jgi:hypothetical protein
MRTSDAHSYGGLGRPDRRRPRKTPRARLWPGHRLQYPALSPSAWYPVYAEAPRIATHVWLRTAHGLIRVERAHVEVQAAEV